MTHRTIAALCERSREISLEKGWLNPDGTDPRPFHIVTSLFHSEVTEAFEDIRSNRDIRELYYEVKFKEDNGTITKEEISFMSIAEARKVEGKYGRGRDFLDAKPCGVPVELADFVIRVAQFYGSALLSDKLEETVRNAANLQHTDRAIPETGEKLVSLLHVDIARAEMASAGPHPIDDPMHHLAVALHTLFDFCSRKDIDIWAAIDEKEAYNRTRPHKHGGKKM
jgi:hypothetical protein